MSNDKYTLIDEAYRCMENGQFDAAGQLLASVLETDPGHADALQLLGMVHAMSGRPREAADLLRRACRLEPRNVILLANLARACWEAGQVQEAADTWDEIIALGQADADVWSDRAIVLHSLGRSDEALASLERAVDLAPEHAGAWINRGTILHHLGRFDEALDCHEKSVVLQPGAAAGWVNKAATLERMEQFEQALACHDMALSLAPRQAATWSNRGVTLRKLGRLEESMDSYNQAIALDASCVNAWINRGALQNDQQQHEQALRDYDRALQIEPGHGEALSGAALARLAIGEFEPGWRSYEWRWQRADAEARRHKKLPLWLGEQVLAGKRILLWAEQGMGDTLQFCRYVPHVAELGAEVVLEVQPALQRLLACSFPQATVLAIGAALPACDFQTPLLSLPLALHTTPDTIPAQVPYLRTPGSPSQAGAATSVTTTERPASAELAVPPAARIIAAARRPRIGIACSGRRSYGANHHRAMPLAAFAPLQKVADLVLLQKELSADDAVFLRGNAAIKHPLDHMGDFADTACLAGQLDLIISVDTALAHLAGALALPVWLLLSWTADWRWQNQREDSPWYPGMRLFRQDRVGNWDGVIVRVLGALAELPAKPA